MRASFKTLLAAAILFNGAAAIQPSSVSAQTAPVNELVAAIQNGDVKSDYAQYRRYHYRGGPRYVARGYYGRPYYGRRYGYYGPRYRYGYYNRYPYRHYYRRGYGYGGGAVVAGLLGGLTLGALASPYYGYGPAYYPPYYYRPAYFGPRCVIESRRVINRYGRRVWRRVEVCY